jgi:hypothetical protein
MSCGTARWAGTGLGYSIQMYVGLEKIREKGEYRSKFIENAVHRFVRQVDPGDSCEALCRIDETLKLEIVSTVSKEDFEIVSTLAIWSIVLNR